MEILQHILFLDRDGTLIREPEDFRVSTVEKLVWLPDAITALAALQRGGFRFVMVSNQDGLGKPDFPQNEFDIPQQHLLQILGDHDVHFDAVLVDHHRAEENHPDRKPNPGMVLNWLNGRSLDTTSCWVIGDRRTDAWLAHNLGIQSLTINDPLSANGDAKFPNIPEAPTTKFYHWLDLFAFLRPHCPSPILDSL